MAFRLALSWAVGYTFLILPQKALIDNNHGTPTPTRIRIPKPAGTRGIGGIFPQKLSKSWTGGNGRTYTSKPS